MMAIPSITDIREAQQRISSKIHRTPVLSSKKIDDRVGCRIFFKCENYQKVGAFKFRGATNAVGLLSKEEARKGVLTHSSGNHAQAVALAAKMRGIPAWIVMPENAPKVKVNAVRGYGAEIRFCEPTLAARETTAEAVIEETGATFIHPYNDARIIAGQGTAALELINENPWLDVMMAPVGGGGIMSGTAIVGKSLRTSLRVIGAEPEQADDAARSFKAGTIIPVENPNTVADGLRTSLADLTFEAVTRFVDDIVTVSEEAIIEAMRYAWERMKIVIEPSAAVPLAALFEGKVEVEPEHEVGIILTGGNVDLDKLPWT